MKNVILISVVLGMVLAGFFGAPFAMEAVEGESVAVEQHAVSASSHESEGHGAASAQTFFWIVVLLLAAKFSSLIEKFGQPSVLGELVVGVILGNLVLLGINFFEPIKTDSMITFLAELGVVILLFQIGLESNISEMRKFGPRALIVAIVGVIAPFILGAYVVGPWIMPGLSQNAYLFLGAALTATSVGITARVFKDLGKLKSKEAQIVLGAAVIDDVFGLIILAVVSALVVTASVSIFSIGWIVVTAIGFLVGAIVLGQLAAPHIGKAFSKINTGVGMKFTLALCFGLLFAFVAQKVGLAPIVGAFAAGLVLDPVHFKFFKNPEMIEDIKEVRKDVNPKIRSKIDYLIRKHQRKHMEDLIEPLSFLLVPLFFVFTGMSVNLETMFDPKILLVALVITLVAFVGKLISGLVAGKVNKQIVGWGMVPRGEVGLIFATIGKSLGVVNDEVFSVIVIMVILTTLVTPIILNYLLKKQKPEAELKPAHSAA